ncbi:TetR/AcrR family transcriptional regulator [soil metagenome]
MTETVTNHREIGRPRSFHDETIFRATGTVLSQVGNENITLAMIAGVVGCSAPALVQRFGSKQALLKSFSTWSIEQTRLRFESEAVTHQSPLETLKARVQIPGADRPAEIFEPDGYPSTVYLHVAAWNDEAFRDLVTERTRIIEDELTRLLEQAIEAGEISGCHPRNMAETLLTAFSGAALQSIGMRRKPIEDRLVDLVDILLKPYLTFSKPAA